jgi:hypothetical protein
LSVCCSAARSGTSSVAPPSTAIAILTLPGRSAAHALALRRQARLTGFLPVAVRLLSSIAQGELDLLALRVCSPIASRRMGSKRVISKQYFAPDQVT